MQNDTLLSPLKDARVRAVIERIVEARRIHRAAARASVRK